MATKIEVEWIAQAQTMSAALERINKKLDEQDKKLEEIGKTSKKAADAAAGSFNALQNELRDAEDALRNMSAGTAEFEKQRKEVERLRSAVGEAKTSMSSTLQLSFGQKMLAGAQGVLAAKNIVMEYVDAVDQLRQKSEQIIEVAADAALEIDGMTRAMQVQMGLTEDDAKVQRQRTLEVAKAAGVTPQAAFQAETQLSSSAFDAGVLDTILKITQATNFEGNTAEVVQGVAQVLNAYQLDRSQVNTEKLGASLVNLFRDTDLQMQDLGDFAKNASVFENAGLKLEQSLAAFAGLRNIYQGSESGTGLRNFVSILQSAAGDKSKNEALQSMGLKAGQVDFVGEDLIQVIQTLRDATSKMSAEDSNVAMSKIFGRENVAVANTLLQMDTQIQEFTAIQGDLAALEEKAIVKRESMQADLNRREIERIEQQISREDELHALRLAIIDRENAILARQEASALTSNIGGGLSTATGYATRLLNMAPGMNTELSYNLASIFTGEGIVNQIAGLLKEQNEETKALRRDMNAVMNQNRRPAQNGRPKEDPLPNLTVP